MPSEEDTLFAKLAADIGCVTAAQVDECLGNQKAMAEMGINQDLGQIMVSKGYLSGEALREIRSELRGRSGKHELIGPYEILEKLGQGGMGTVYKARIKTTNAVIALKVLPPHLAANETFVTRFHREAELAAKLDHPNIVVAIESGQSEGCHYFAMEYVEGETLGDRLKREGLIAEDQALQITRQVALGLERAS